MTTRFPIRFSPVNRVFLMLLGMGPRWSYVDLGSHDLRVKMSYGFRATVARSSITGATVVGKIPWGWGIGVHGWHGLWVVNGSLRDVVRVEIDPPARARVLGVPVKLRQLRVSLEDPEGFLRAIGR
ncbi:MAG: hypothetical protein ACRD2W_03010 [Acidimicrobiales bacterium]